MTKTLCLLVPILLAILASACGRVEWSPAPLGIRLAFDPAIDPVDSAIEFELRGELIKLGPEQDFDVDHVGITADYHGLPAVTFTISPEDTPRFTQWTAANVGKKLGLVVEDELLSYATIESALPGGGLITGGPEGFTIEKVVEIVTKLREGQRPRK